MAYRRAANRFEAARLQCRAPLDDGVIEQFEHQPEGRQFLFLDGAVIVTFERFTYDGVDLALHRQEFWLDSAVRTLETMARILLRLSSRSSQFK